MNTSMIIVAIVSSLITCLFMYLDSRLFDTPRTKFTYFKNMVLVSGISVAIVYFMGGNAGNTGKFQLGGVPASSTAVISGIDQEIFTGPPAF